MLSKRPVAPSRLNKFLFLVILIVAFGLRFYRLGSIPLSLDWDENSNAYNAYSILKTGRDEYGDFLPITNRSFEDYKPPLYMYLNVPAVAIWGLTPFAARLPSALFGFLTIPAVYFLSKKLFSVQSEKFNESVALLSMFFVATSPWHLQFSRVGFEATVGLFFAIASITCFLYGLASKKLLILAGIFLGISTYSYHAERIFVPLLFLATFIIYFKRILSISKIYLACFVTTAIMIALPLAILIPPKVILERFEVTTGRPRLEDINKSIKYILQDKELGLKFGKYIHNRRLVIGQSYIGNYISHFDPNFLFLKGDDNFRHHIGNMGMIYFFQLPLLIYGLYNLLRYRNKASAFLISWLLIAPIPASPAVPNPHANRSLPMDTALQIVSAFALVLFWSKNFKLKKITSFAFGSLIAISIFAYLENYWRHYPYDKSGFWQYGYSQAAQESEKIKDQYQKIYVHDSLEQAYAFWLFNTKFDPKTYQEKYDKSHFDKYFFSANIPTKQDELFIAVGMPGDFILVKTIYYPDGSPTVKIGHPR